MTSSTLASTLAVLGLILGIGVLGYLVGREVDRTARLGRDNRHRPGGYPVEPSSPTHPPVPLTPDRLRGTMPAASELRFGSPGKACEARPAA